MKKRYRHETEREEESQKRDDHVPFCPLEPPLFLIGNRFNHLGLTQVLQHHLAGPSFTREVRRRLSGGVS
jgi:hypothetical protein